MTEEPRYQKLRRRMEVASRDFMEARHELYKEIGVPAEKDEVFPGWDASNNTYWTTDDEARRRKELERMAQQDEEVARAKANQKAYWTIHTEPRTGQDAFDEAHADKGDGFRAVTLNPTKLKDRASSSAHPRKVDRANNGMHFESHDIVFHPGISKLEFFTAAALTGILAFDDNDRASEKANRACEVAMATLRVLMDMEMEEI